jgi:hypothetical protein
LGFAPQTSLLTVIPLRFKPACGQCLLNSALFITSGAALVQARDTLPRLRSMPLATLSHKSKLGKITIKFSSMENARESNGIAYYEKPNSIITNTDSIGIIFSFEFFNIADITEILTD